MKKIITKKRIIIASLLIIIAVTVSVFVLISKNKTEGIDTEVTIKASADQTITYAKITSINGNDIDVAIQNVKKDNSLPVDNGGDAGNINPPDGMPSIPDGAEPPSSGSMPELPGGGDIPNMPGGSVMSGGSGTAQKKNTKTNRESYEDTGDTASYQIPVGTDVITKLGAVTTFTHLDAGDVIAILTSADDDTILKIWIVQ